MLVPINLQLHSLLTQPHLFDALEIVSSISHVLSPRVNTT
jgi:hypothetical protein